MKYSLLLVSILLSACTSDLFVRNVNYAPPSTEAGRACVEQCQASAGPKKKDYKVCYELCGGQVIPG